MGLTGITILVYSMSRGCINLKTEDAKWIFRWGTPVSEVTKLKHVDLEQVIVTVI